MSSLPPPPALTPLTPTSSTSLRSSLPSPSNVTLTVLDTGVDPCTPALGGRVTCYDLSGSSDVRMSKIDDLNKHAEEKGLKAGAFEAGGGGEGGPPSEETRPWMHASVSLSSFLPGPAKKRLDDAARLAFKTSHDAALLALEKGRPTKPDPKKATEEDHDRWSDYEALKKELTSSLKKHQSSPPGSIVDLYLSPSSTLHASSAEGSLRPLPLNSPFSLDASSSSTFTARLLPPGPAPLLSATLQLVTDCGAHGTHVACISAGEDGVCPKALVESYR